MIKLKRPFCCPDKSCTPIHQIKSSVWPDLSVSKDGESFLCFGQMSKIIFVYNGVYHNNDLCTCTLSPLKGLIRFHENIEDWQLLRDGYRDALEVIRNDEREETKDTP